jgi:ankyrin repeat protein
MEVIMTTQQLPERPNLEQLKKQAKDLLASAKNKNTAALARFRALPALAQKTDTELAALNFALHDAQSAVAREFGFPSWNALRERVEELTLQFDEAVATFTRGSLDQRLTRAERLLTRFPNLIAENFHAALAYGDAAAVAKHLARDPALATKPSGPHDWAPLIYVAHSHWARKNADGLVAVTRLLLAHGASPDTSYPLHGNPKEPLSALWAATCQSRNAGLAKLLLEAGANPNDGESVYHAAENGDVAMLELLAQHGALADGGKGAEPWGNTPLYFILGHYAGLAHDADVRRGAAWLLAHGANPNRVCYPDKSGETPLHAAARHWDAAMIELLVAHGADLHARRRDGKNALTLAELNGRTSAAAALRARGVAEELQPDERFLAACMRGDREEALRLRDPTSIVKHAQQFLECGTHAIETMLACGFDVGTTGGLGETKLHWAAFHGDVAAAGLLITHGAPLDLRDRIHRSPPLGWADYAEVNATNPNGDYAGVARALLAAGASIPPPDELENWGSEVVLEVIAEFRRQSSAGL